MKKVNSISFVVTPTLRQELIRFYREFRDDAHVARHSLTFVFSFFELFVLTVDSVI